MRRLSSRSLARRAPWLLLAGALLVPNTGCMAVVAAIAGGSGQTVAAIAEAEVGIAAAVASGVVSATASDARPEPIEEPALEEVRLTLGFPIESEGVCSSIHVGHPGRGYHRQVQPGVDEDGRYMFVRLTPGEELAYRRGPGLDFSVCGRTIHARGGHQMET